MKTFYPKIMNNVMANGGKIKSLAWMIRGLGYSESYARNPQKFMNTKQGKAILKKSVHDLDEDIFKVLSQLLKVKKLMTMRFPALMSNKDILEVLQGEEVISINPTRNGKLAHYYVPDNQVIAQALDIACKLKGLYKTPSLETSTPYIDFSDIDLDREINRLKGILS